MSNLSVKQTGKTRLHFFPVGIFILISFIKRTTELDIFSSSSLDTSINVVQMKDYPCLQDYPAKNQPSYLNITKRKVTRVVECFHEMWVSLLTPYTDTLHSLICTEEVGSNDGETRRVTERVNLVQARGRETPVPYSSLDTEPIISLSRQYVLKHGDMTGAMAPAS